MSSLLWILLSTIIVSLVAFIGIITLSVKDKLLKKIVLFLVALSAGALIGGAFLHLLPESLDYLDADTALIYVLIGFVAFYLVEKVLHWRHCHEGKCPVHTFAYMNLIGDAVHNFIDGLIIAATFLINIGLGITATIAIILHEVPQEIGDFGVLIYGGFKKKKAIMLNFLTALIAILGGLTGYLLSSLSQSINSLLLPFAAGGFIYIGATDLLPEVKKVIKLKHSIGIFIIFIAGIVLMQLIKILGV